MLTDLLNDNVTVNLVSDISLCTHSNYKLSDSFIIVHQNIRSLRSNFDNLVSNLNAFNRLPDIIFLTELWIYSLEVDNFSIPNYTFFCCSK